MLKSALYHVSATVFTQKTADVAKLSEWRVEMVISVSKWG